MNLKRKLHELAQSKRVHTVVCEGVAYTTDDEETVRSSMVVIKTFFLNGIMLQGVGVSYLNPDDCGDYDLGIKLASGRAELSLGAQIYSYLLCKDEKTLRKLHKIQLNSVHRLPGDRAWKKASGKQRRITSSGNTASAALQARVLVGRNSAAERRFSDNGSSSNQSAPSAAEPAPVILGDVKQTENTTIYGDAGNSGKCNCDMCQRK